MVLFLKQSTAGTSLIVNLGNESHIVADCRVRKRMEKTGEFSEKMQNDRPRIRAVALDYFLGIVVYLALVGKTKIFVSLLLE